MSLRRATSYSKRPEWELRGSPAASSNPPPLPANPVAEPQPRPWTWPDVCLKLLKQAGSGFEKLALDLWGTAVSRGWQSIACTSAWRREGRTTFVLTLGRMLASSGGGPVLIWDADWRHPTVGSRLGLAEPPAVEDVLSGRVRWQQAVRHWDAGALSVLTTLPGTGDYLDQPEASRQLMRLSSELRGHYGLILIDAGPLELHACPETLWRRDVVDAVLWINDRRKRGRPTLDPQRQFWSRQEIELLGMIETFA